MIRSVVQGVGRFGLVATMLYAGLAGEGLVSLRVAAAHAAPEGFGASTLGGSGKATYRVTSLADSGAGTLRDALAQGNRTIVFDVAGTIPVRSSLFVRGGYVTIDGSTAPAPGITLSHTGLDAPILAIRGDNGAHDVIVRGIRIRGPYNRDTNLSSSNDCMTISRGTYNVLIDRVSISGCSDGGIDIVGDSSNPGAVTTRDVTIQRSIIGDNRKMMMVNYGTTRISMHHNLFVLGVVRMPLVTRTELPIDSDTTLDFRNNVVWDWGPGSGTSISSGVKANVINNTWKNPTGGTADKAQALSVCRGDGVETPSSLGSCSPSVPDVRAYAYVAGNVSLDGVNIDAQRTVSTAYPAAPVTTATACSAAQDVAATAGAQPRDADDVDLVRLLALPTCATETPTPTPTPTPITPTKPDLVTTSVRTVSTVARNVKFGIDFTVANQGKAVAPASRYVISLSRDKIRSSDDVILRIRDIPVINPGVVTNHGISEYVPVTAGKGAYYLLFISDADSDVAESSETNNILAWPITVR